MLRILAPPRPAPRRSCAASLTDVPPADLQGLSSIKRISKLEDSMSQLRHDHAAFDRFPDLVRGLTAEFGSDGIGAIVDRFIAAERAEFCWEGRFAEMNLGEFESIDGEFEACDLVAVMGYFRGRYYVATCVVDQERGVRALLKVRQFDCFESAETAFLVGI
jgi:hypothetical protein